MTRCNGDPIGSDAPRGKSNAARKGRYDGSYSGTEQRKKDKLMRQFMRTGEGPGAPSEAYRNASCWCACGRLRVAGASACERHTPEREVRCHNARAMSDHRGIDVVHYEAIGVDIQSDEVRAIILSNEAIQAGIETDYVRLDAYPRPNGWEIDDEIRAAIAVECPIRNVPWAAGEVLGRVMTRLRGRANPGRAAELIRVWMDASETPHAD